MNQKQFKIKYLTKKLEEATGRKVSLKESTHKIYNLNKILELCDELNDEIATARGEYGTEEFPKLLKFQQSLLNFSTDLQREYKSNDSLEEDVSMSEDQIIQKPDTVKKLTDKKIDIKLTENKKKDKKILKENIKSVWADGESDWDKIQELFGENLEFGPNGDDEQFNLLKGSKKLLKVEDDFGWDFVYLLRDGRIYYPDRNSGVDNITKSPIEDIKLFIKKLIDLLQGTEKDW